MKPGRPVLIAPQTEPEAEQVSRTSKGPQSVELAVALECCALLPTMGVTARQLSSLQCRVKQLLHLSCH